MGLTDKYMKEERKRKSSGERGIYRNRERKPREIGRDRESEGEGNRVGEKDLHRFNRRYETERMREKKSLRGDECRGERIRQTHKHRVLCYV